VNAGRRGRAAVALGIALAATLGVALTVAASARAPTATLVAASAAPAATRASDSAGTGPRCRWRDLAAGSGQPTRTPDGAAAYRAELRTADGADPCVLEVGGLIVLRDDGGYARGVADARHPGGVLVRPGAPVHLELWGASAASCPGSGVREVVVEVQAQILARIPTTGPALCGDLHVGLVGSVGTVTPRPPTVVPPGTPLPEAARDRFLVSSAAFSSASSGWVVGPSCRRTTPCRTLVQHTADAGRTWSVVSELGVDLSPNPDVEAPVASVRLVAADERDLLAVAQHGYDVTGLVSTDAGRSWQAPSIPGVTNPSGVLAAGGEGRFWLLVTDRATPDGPVHLFRLVPGAPATAEGTIPGASSLAVSDDTAYVTSPDGRLVVTTATGTTTDRTLPANGGVSTVPGGGLVLAAQNSAAAGSGPKQAWSSSDGGRTWSRLPDPPYGGDLGGLDVAPGGREFLTTGGGDSALQTSDDGGRTWRRVLAFPDGGAGLGDLALPDATSGYLVHGRPDLAGTGNQGRDLDSLIDALGLWATSDGGRTWHHVDTPAA